MSDVDPRTPVLVGVGIVGQREQDPANAREAVALMSDALVAAGRDSGVAALPSQAQAIYVPQGLWSYQDPARMIAEAVGAHDARSVLAKIGIMQQSLMDDACCRIADGDIDVAVVAGGEARYRALRAQIAGGEAPETASVSEPDETMEPEAELYHEAEVAALGHMPVGYYAIIESAIRARRGIGMAQHRDDLARLYSEFSAIGADNPHAWKRQRFAPEAIRDPSDKNPMLAYPYTKLHNTSWNVDQASALLFCSAAKARALGIARDQWVFPVASAASNYMLSLAQRPELGRLPGARLAGEALLRYAATDVENIDLIELYSCFPAAVELYAEELGLAAGVPLTVTGGMPFAGGPLNNFVLQSTSRMAQLLREQVGSNGLVSTVSGLMTKQAFALWSRQAPVNKFAALDVSATVAAQCPPLEVVTGYSGRAQIAGYTVLYVSGSRQRAVAVLDLPAGRRTLAVSEDALLMEAMEQREFCGCVVDVAGGVFSPVNG
jgi:acetyl-CoA C-acetyltransferase